MSTLIYLNGVGEAVTVAIGNPPTDESGQPIYPPVEATVEVHVPKENIPIDIIVPAKAICNGIMIAETMTVGDDRALVPSHTNGRASLRQALAEHDALLQLQVLPRLTVKGVKTETLLQTFGKLQAAKCPFGLMAFSSSIQRSSVSDQHGDHHKDDVTNITHVSLAAMGPLMFGDFLGALAHFLQANPGQLHRRTIDTEIHYKLAISTQQTRQGDYGMEGEEWIECLFGSKTARTPFAALQGSGAAWSKCAGHYVDPNGVYNVLAQEVKRLGSILADVLSDENDGGDETNENDNGGDETNETNDTIENEPDPEPDHSSTPPDDTVNETNDE